jgi:hypothetical protein
MKGDAKVIEYLNRGLRHELSAINQYWLHYRLLDNWGYKDLAKQWRAESILDPASSIPAGVHMRHRPLRNGHWLEHRRTQKRG